MKTFKEFLTESKKISHEQAKEKFCFGHCASFAHALHDHIGGEVKQMNHPAAIHYFVKKDGKNYDVMGKRNISDMAHDLTGDMLGWKEGETVDKSKLKTNSRALKMAHEYIKSNLEKWK